MGASGIHVATCVRPAPIAEDGTLLGHEVLIADTGCSFNSPESLHVDERKCLDEVGVVLNEHELIESFDDALVCCRMIEPPSAEARGPAWLPWLIVRYRL